MKLLRRDGALIVESWSSDEEKELQEFADAGFHLKVTKDCLSTTGLLSEDLDQHEVS